MEKQQIDDLATANGYKSIPVSNPYMYSYLKDGIRINVYWGRMTVGTCLFHPKLGRTQLFRRNVTPEQLAKIFENPRTHTGKGYYGDTRKIPPNPRELLKQLNVDIKGDGPAKVYITQDLNEICKNRFVRFINSFFN